MSGRRHTLLLLTLDSLTLFGLFNVTAWIRGVVPYGQFIDLPLLFPWLLSVAAIYLIDGYRSRTDMLSVDYASQHGLALMAALALILLGNFVLLPAGFRLQESRAMIALAMASTALISLGYRRSLYQRSARSRQHRVLVFIGDGAGADHFREECTRHKMAREIVFSTIDSDSTAPFLSTGSARSRTVAEIISAIEQGELEVEAIVLKESGRHLPETLSSGLIRLYFQGVPTYTLELFNQIYWRKIPLYRINQTWLFQEGFQIAREPGFDRIKRLADIALSLFGLILAAPILLGAAVFVKLQDGGPVLFSQNRIGRNRISFRAYKLRTMTVQATAPVAGDARYTQPDDPRVTRVGRFLRSSRIDEIPQLWNVLCGDMSLIGPRAEWDRLVEEYERQIPCYHFRHLVRPGITGWAQVNYPYGANLEDTRRKLEYDLYYIRHFSFLLDASIVLKTIHTMLFGRGR